MRWSDRQAALLRAMGLQPWGPQPAATANDGAPPAAATVVDPPADSEPLRTTAAPVAGTPSAPQAAPPARRIGAPVAAASQTAPLRAAAGAIVVEPPRSPAASAVSTLDWPALEQAVAGCTACELSQTRRRTVFGVGHRQARWMVVGEAPGEQEDERGEPFVGPAGQLLDRMLAAVGLSRDADADPDARVYIANTLKCRPPRNRNPEADELAKCEPFLVRQIELVRPRLIVAMGRFAVQSLLRSDAPVGQLRGRVHRYHGVPLVVTYHPAYLLRNPADKARAWDDLCLAAQTADASIDASVDATSGA